MAILLTLNHSVIAMCSSSATSVCSHLSTVSATIGRISRIPNIVYHYTKMFAVSLSYIPDRELP